MKNFKTFIILIMNALSIALTAQVTMDVKEEDIESSADFQIYSKDKGFALPQIALKSLTEYSPIVTKPIDGLLVYNTTENSTLNLNKGLYYWYNDQWNRMGKVEHRSTIIQNVNEEYLGYKLATTVSAPETLANATKTVCKKWEIKDGGNGHTYCGYKKTTSDLKFEDVFNAAKNQGGYVVTINSTGEWDFINNNIIKASGKELNGAIWLGYVRLATPGNNAKYNWITGEKTNHVWGNTSYTQDRFESGHPEKPSDDGYNVTKVARCTFIKPKNTNEDRLWSSSTCTTTTNHNNFIIEFNN